MSFKESASEKSVYARMVVREDQRRKEKKAELLSDYKCSIPMCNWTRLSTTWEKASKAFGNHNRTEHDGQATLMLVESTS